MSGYLYGLFTANPFGTRSIAKEKDGLVFEEVIELRQCVIFPTKVIMMSIDILKAWVDYVSGTCGLHLF